MKMNAVPITLVIAGMPLLFCEPASAEDRRPNVLFIFADDMGYGDLGFTGSTQIKTPNLDALAQGGIVFPQAYVTAPVCGPSRAGLLTGRYQQRFGFEANPGGGESIRQDMVGLHVREKTLGDRMRACGYHTACIGKWHMGSDDHFYPTQRGFDYFFGMRGGGHRYILDLNPSTPGWYPTFALERMGKRLDRIEVPYLTDWFTEEATDYMDRRAQEGDQPWFMYVCYNCPHGPLEAKEEDIARYGHVEHKGRRTYCAMLDCFDQNVGKLVATLKENGQYDNTVIFFLNDNGGSVETVHAINAPFWGTKGSFYEGGIRVPMFLHSPKRFKPGTYPHPVISVDVMPTLVALGGGSLEPEIIRKGKKQVPVIYDGVDLLPYLAGDKADERPHDKLYWRIMSHGGAMRDGDWKLIFTPHDPPQLYDLSRDIAERDDLAAGHSEIVARMMDDHNQWCGSHERAPLWLGSPSWYSFSRKNHRKDYQLTQP
ncbi:MAG: sulfatase-like hydrolase/transferase [Fuerstiella sp.]|nr:sulfatase-like hydrolase/transferase [Fuerstiella sp.]